MPYVILVVFPQVLFKMLQSSYIYHKGEVFPSAFIPHVGMERQPLQICVYKHLLVQETLQETIYYVFFCWDASKCQVLNEIFLPQFLISQSFDTAKALPICSHWNRREEF